MPYSYIINNVYGYAFLYSLHNYIGGREKRQP